MSAHPQIRLVDRGRPRRLSHAEVAALTADRVAAYRARRQEGGLQDAPGRTHDAPPAEVSPASPPSWRRASTWRYIRAATDASLAALALIGLVALVGGGAAWGMASAAVALAVFQAALILEQLQERPAGDGQVVPGRWIRRAR